MLHVITRLALSTIATASLLVVLLCPCGLVFAQGSKASAESDGRGSFVGPHGQARGGTLLLGLEIAFVLDKNTSPALIYGISRPIGEATRFAYICVVNHRYTGNIEDVSSQFRYRLHVVDGTGELELSSGTGKSSFKIVYSTVVKWDKNVRIDESLTICKTPVELHHGRIFFVDMSGESPVVNQVDYPLPDALGDSQDRDKKVRKVVDDLKESIAAGRSNKRLLKLLFPNDEHNPNGLEGTEQLDWLPDPQRNKETKGTTCGCHWLRQCRSGRRVL
jgi:hypothetical protein